MTSVGPASPEPRPRPVARILNNLYKKQEVVLSELNAGRQEFQNNKFYSLFTGNLSMPVAYMHLGTVNTCRTGGCSLSQDFSGSGPNGEYFDYMILFNTALEVESINVFNYQASFGHEIAARGWLKQFNGFKGEKNLEPGKNIDSISGATVSVYAITADIQWKTRQLQEIIH